MKIYIYRQLLSPSILDFYRQLYKENAFVHHYYWFKDILDHLTAYETTNPDEADYFYIPLFLIPFQFKKMDISHLILDCAYLDRGKHLLFASGDYGQRKRSPYEGHHPGRAYPEIYPWLDERFILLALESTADLLPQDIALFPYQYRDPTSQIVGRSGLSRTRRDLLYSFCGAMSYPQLPPNHVRGGALSAIAGKGQDWFIGPPHEAISNFGKVHGQGTALFKRSIFALCPAGFGRWSFRFIEALLQGAIPVLIADGYILPFQDEIPWQDYVITYKEEALAGLDDYLRDFPSGRMLAMQTNIERDMALFGKSTCLELMAKKLEDRISPC